MIRNVCLLSVAGLLTCWCLSKCAGQEIDYEVMVVFVDQSFVYPKENYRFTEDVYVTASETIEADMPDVVTIVVSSSKGDEEIISAWPQIDYGFERKVHNGSIDLVAFCEVEKNNGHLEVDIDGTVTAYYNVKTQYSFSTARITAD